MWYRAKGWDVWVALGFSAAMVFSIVFQRWWYLALHTAWLIGYFLWRHSRQVPPLPDDRPGRPPTTRSPQGSGWTFERNPDGSYTWTSADGRRVVMD